VQATGGIRRPFRDSAPKAGLAFSCQVPSLPVKPAAILSMSLRALFAKQSLRQNWWIASLAGTLARNDILILRIAAKTNRWAHNFLSVLQFNQNGSIQ